MIYSSKRVTMDLSGSYRSVADTVLAHATQVADPFNVASVANERLDEVRRRVQNEALGHRGRKSDPLYRRGAPGPKRCPP